jgi:small-conductance mechanosensitive channel
MFPEIMLSPAAITWISVILGIVVSLAIRDIANNLVQGFLFYIDSTFKAGDLVYIDGEKAVIISVGLRTTVFNIKNGRGNTWRYVANEKIKSLKLEKVIEDRDKELLNEHNHRLREIEHALEKLVKNSGENNNESRR